MLYTEAIDRLQALGAELHTSPGQPRRKFELAQMRTLMAALGDPQQSFPSVLIAGTNGKGSTASTLAAILAASGLRTGLYTSPHLVRVNERIQILTPAPGAAHEVPTLRIEDTLIPDDDFSRHLEAVIHAAERLVSEGRLPGPPSFFETVTAMAFLHFAGLQENAAPVDIAVLEVGLGGRLDATNIVQPALSIITDISLDHTEWLGHTIPEIAREKAGILRPNGILVTLPQHPEANQAIGEAAVALNVRAINAAAALPFDTHAVTNIRNRYPLDLVTGKDDGLHIEVDSPLAGQHQQRNIALAITAALELRNILQPAPPPRTAEPRVPHPEQSEGWAITTPRVPHPEQSEGWDTQPPPPASHLSSRPEPSRASGTGEAEGSAFLAAATNPNVSDQRERTPQYAPQAQAPRTASPRVPHPEQSEGWDTQPLPPASHLSSRPEPSRASGTGEAEGSAFLAASANPNVSDQRERTPQRAPQAQAPRTASPRVPHSSEARVGESRRSESGSPNCAVFAGWGGEATYISISESYDINPASIAAGIHQTRWPARLEHLTRGHQHILLDVGHNPAGAWTLRAALAAEAHPPRVILFGCLDDKPVEELAQILFPLFDRVLLVPVPSPRAASAARLLAAAQSVTATATIQPDLVTALAAVVEQDAVITGSVYLVGEARGLLMAAGWASDAG